jgi:menaquinone-dependent protoporphyrinogen oxidase
MRVLIVYASKYGQTQRIAEHIADVMRSAGEEAFVREASDLPRDIVPHAADLVIAAGSVYFGKHAKALERFVIKQRASLAKTRTVFISVSGAARSVDSMSVAEENAKKFLAKTGWTPDRIALFAGGEPYTRYGFFTRFIMKKINRERGVTVDTKKDYDFTDWNAVTRFARELVGKDVEVREPDLALL